MTSQANALELIMKNAYQSQHPEYNQLIQAYRAMFNKIHSESQSQSDVTDTLFNLVWTMNALSAIKENKSDPMRPTITFLRGSILSSDLHYLPAQGTYTPHISHRYMIDQTYPSLQSYPSLQLVLKKKYRTGHDHETFLKRVQELYIDPIKNNQLNPGDPEVHHEITRIPYLPILYQNHLGRVILSRYQVSRIIAYMMTQFNERLGKYEYYDKSNGSTTENRINNFPTLNFTTLYDNVSKESHLPTEYQSEFLKFQCIYEGYMKRWLDGEFDNDPIHKEYIVYSRHHCADPPNEMFWSKMKRDMASVKLFDNIPIMQDEPDQSVIHVVCTNSKIGEGVLYGINQYDEIRFVIEPECIASMLFFEAMGHSDCITITGTKPYSNVNVEDTPSFIKYKYIDNLTDIKTQKISHITAIDAVDYREDDRNIRINENEPFHDEPFRQLRIHQSKRDFLRDLNKAYIGFQSRQYEHKEKTSIQHSDLLVPVPLSVPKNPFILKDPIDHIPQNMIPPRDYRVINTGHWGCGAFMGNVDIKAIQQWMAATLAKRDLHYCTNMCFIDNVDNDPVNESYQDRLLFSSQKFKDKFQKVIDHVKFNNLTLSSLFQYVQQYGTYLENDKNEDCTLFDFILTYGKKVPMESV